MLLFRSEEDAPREGATVPVDTLRRLGAAWYGDRLDPAWRPRPPQRSQELLTDHGLTGDFWRLPGV